MMSNQTLEGSCLCGTIRYHVTPPFIQFYHCHCSQCRKSTGTAHGANLYAKRDNVSWVSGVENIVRYDLMPAKRFASVFCKTCGSKIPYPRDKELMIIPAGSLDSELTIKPSLRVFWDSRATWDNAEEALEKFSERPEQWPYYQHE
jgi:hypothetical protein